MGFLCNICPRKCNAVRNENEGNGICTMGSELKIARAAAHFWEEPCISGVSGSGAVFFSGCNLKCVFCQNSEISGNGFGKVISVDRLRKIYDELIDFGVHNINLVTPTHYSEKILESLDKPLGVPVIYNTSAYDDVDELKKFEGKINIYLPDLKYCNSDIARKYSKAEDYPEKAKNAILEMYRQVGSCEFDDDGMLIKGVLIRHLMLPENSVNTYDVIDWVADTFPQGDVYFSLMRQYTPPENGCKFAELNGTITDDEYEKAVDYMYLCGIENGFVQDGNSAGFEYTPPFNLEGV